MTKRIISILLVVALLMTCFTGVYAVETVASDAGSGTAEDPYEISTTEQFVEFLQNASNTTGTTRYYRLTADIQADEQGPLQTASAANDIVLDGNGHTVSGFSVTGAFFSKITASTFRYVNFSNITVSDPGGSTAVLSLEADASSKILGCTFDECTVNGADDAVKKTAVIVCTNQANIINCTVTDRCLIRGDAEKAGGIAAENSKNGVIYNCLCEVSIPYAAGTVGALVGKNSGILQHCYASVPGGYNIFGSSSGAYASVSNCLRQKGGVYSLINGKKSKDYDEGIDLRILAADMSEGTESSNKKLKPEDTDEYGCLWAVEDGEFTLSLDGRTAQIYLYADETLNGTTFTFTDKQVLECEVASGQKFSVRVGYEDSGVYYSNSFTMRYQLEDSYTMVNNFKYSPNQDYVKTLPNIIDGVADVTYLDVYISATYDRETGTSTGSSILYPYCATLSLTNTAEKDEIVDYRFAGSGTEDDPYQISSAYELNCLSYYVQQQKYSGDLPFNEAYYMLTCDVDMSGEDFTPIGTYSRDYSTAFRGSFDGQGYEISNLSCAAGQNYRGLFGITSGRMVDSVMVNAVIKNLNVSGLTFGTDQTSGDMVGGIVGMAVNTTIDGCVVQGSITADTQMGGIVGYAYYSRIVNCGANVDITTLSYCAWSGGIVGYSQYSTIDNCYSACGFTNKNVILEAYLNTGAIAGHIKKSTFQNCYYLNAHQINVGSNSIGITQVTGDTLVSEDFAARLQTYSEGQGFCSAWETSGVLDWNEGYPVIQLSKDHSFKVTCEPTTAGTVRCLEVGTGSPLEQCRYSPGRTVVITTEDDGLQNLIIVDANAQVLDIPVTREGAYTFSFTMPDQSVWIVPDFGISALCGHGTQEDPYWIYSKESLDAMAHLINSGTACAEGCAEYQSAYYVMLRDVNYSGKAITPISTFSGYFDGNGHRIYNAQLSGIQTAMFLDLTNAAIRNLVMEKITVMSQDSALLAHTASGNTTLANIMLLDLECSGANCASLVYESQDTLSIVNCLLENAEFTGSTNAGLLYKVASGSAVLKNILISNADGCASTVCENKGSITPENVFYYETTCQDTATYGAECECTWDFAASLSAYAMGQLSGYDACLWTVANLQSTNHVRPRLAFGGVDAISAISYADVFSASPVKLLDMGSLPTTAAAGEIVELPYYVNSSTANLRFICQDGTELDFTLETEELTGEKGIIRFEMPAGAVTVDNNGQPLKLLYLEGEGTQSAPFEIWTPADLVLMADVISQRQLQYIFSEDYVDYTDACFVLKADLDMEGVAWEGIGTDIYTFFGVLDGNGHTIKNLNVNNGQGDTNRPGLFISIGEGGTVKNLVMDSAAVFPGGVMNASGIITYKNMGTIAQCEVVDSSVSLGNYEYLGGIAGVNADTGVIIHCAVRNSSFVRRYSGAGNRPMGGITQHNDGAVYCCYVYGCSFTNGTAASDAIVVSGTAPVNCYYDSEMTGVAGTYGTSAARTVFTSGEVTYKLNCSFATALQPWGQNIDNGEENQGYPVLWSAKVYPAGNCTAITGYSNFDTQGGHIFSGNGFCIYCDAYQPATDVDNDGVYEIGNAGQLYWFAQLVNNGVTNASAILNNDISINNDDDDLRDWIMIGSQRQPFIGRFDGRGHTISLLYVADTNVDYMGLFGRIGSRGIVRNVAVDTYFYGRSYLGGIAGCNEGLIQYCYSTAVLYGYGQFTGGIAGENSGTIDNCYHTGIISNDKSVGGLVGRNTGTLSNSHTVGSITGSNPGSLAATNEGEIINCYYLADTDDGNGGKTEAQFTSGEVAYLLQGKQEKQIWGQNVDNGEENQGYPVLWGAKVYDVSNCAQKQYSNTNSGQTYHVYDSNGFCTVCGAYQAATDVDSNGVYEISNAGQLFWFAAVVNGGYEDTPQNAEADAIVTRDIQYDYYDILQPWSMIGSESNPYLGCFDGQGYEISTLAIFKFEEQVDFTGMFGCIGNGGVVKNVNVYGYFYGTSYVGGITGYNAGIIENCLSTGFTYFSGSYGGGIAGYNLGTISWCGSTGTVIGGEDNCGGIAGYNLGTICYSYNSGHLQDTQNYVGGIVGQNNGSIYDCYYTGGISGTTENVGGVVGRNEPGGSVANCYSVGSVPAGTCYTGAVAGCNEGSITNCYYKTGTVINASGIAQNGIGAASADGSTEDVSGVTAEKYYSQFASGEVAYLLQGERAEQIWGQNIDNGETNQEYPALLGAKVYNGGPCHDLKFSNSPLTLTHTYVNGFCTYCSAYQPATDTDSDGVYEITNGGQLFWFAAVVNGGYGDTAQNAAAKAILTADIDLENRNWSPIGSQSQPFTGSLDGQGYCVSRLYCADGTAEYAGMFGSNDGTVKLVGIVNSTFSGSVAGGIAAENSGTISNCYHVGSVSGKTAGGLVGKNTGTVSNCHAVGTILASNGGQVSNCYYLADTDDGVGGKTADQFVSGEVAYLLQGDQSKEIWGQNIDNGGKNQGYPVFYGAKVYAVGQCEVESYSNTNAGSVHDYVNGFCTRCDAYQPAADANGDGVYEISNGGQLYWFAAVVNGGYGNAVGNAAAQGILTADIDLENRNWTPAGSQSVPFAGGLDGQKHTISNLYISTGSEFAGLFGYVGESGTVQNLAVANSNINGGSCVGAIAGFNLGTIQKCSNQATVTGSDHVGGIVGENQGEISDCCNIAVITGSMYVGGLAGNNSGTISNCHNVGTVKATGGNGGEITGSNTGTVQNCYYLADADDGIGGKTADQFASGEVGCLLNGTATVEVWGQNLDNGETNQGYPVLWGAKVYASSLCPVNKYSNFPLAVAHDYANGFCTVCDAYEPAVDTDGDGYYEISNGGQLYWFAELVNGGETEANAVLRANIVVNEDLSSENLRDWLIIGSAEQPYCGAFDGDGYSISGLYFKETVDDVSEENPEYVKAAGLFGSVGTYGTVMNVSLQNSYLCSILYTGGIAGTNYGKIKGCSNSGSVESDMGVAGGIAAGNDGNITDCCSIGTVSGGLTIGGITGRHTSGTVKNCINEGTVGTDTAHGSGVGGIAGMQYSNVIGCVNSGTVIGQWFVGGVVGMNESETVEKCVNTGPVSAANSAGGIAGNNEGIIRNCYNTAAVTGKKYGAGGIVGSNYNTVESCYNIGTVKSESDYAGGIIGSNSDNVSINGLESIAVNCYYLTGCATDNSGTVQNGIGSYKEGTTAEDISGQTEKKTEDQFASGEVCYLLNGSTSERNLAWGQNLDNGQPVQDSPMLDSAVVYHASVCAVKEYSNQRSDQGHYFSDNGFCTYCDAYQPATDSNGDGVYEISNGGQLFWYAAVVNSGYGDAAQNSAARAVLMVDIDLENRAWTPIGSQSQPYAGEFDGQGHTVTKLSVSMTGGFVGLFGYVGESGVVQGVGVAASSVSGANYVGAIAGYSTGIIKKCYNEAPVTGSGNVGGIVGGNYGEISNCYNTGAVTGASNTGGVAGKNDSKCTISHCHNVGEISAENGNPGGIVASNTGMILNCYYLAETEDSSGGKTAAQFASGEVSVLLQDLQSDPVWGQNIDNGRDNPGYPVLFGAQVYTVGTCVEVTGYSNTFCERQHDYGEDEFCDLCGYPWAVMSFYSISLKGNIGLNVYVSLADCVLEAGNAYMQFTMVDGTVNQVPVSEAFELERGGKTYYVFSCEVAAKEMTDLVTCQFFHAYGSTESHSISVKGYADYIIRTDGYAQELKDLVTAMLHYGAAAQLYFGYNTDNLANAALEKPDYSNVTIDGVSIADEQGTSLVRLSHASLVLKSETSLRFFFQVDESVTDFTVTYEGETLEIVQYNDLYYVDVENISAVKLDRNVSVLLNDGSETVTVTYNPMAYCQTVWEDTTGAYADDLKNVVAAMYLYNQAAHAYFDA